jgi:RNA polymerase sigma-70 factor (ECF subfamily)
MTRAPADQIGAPSGAASRAEGALDGPDGADEATRELEELAGGPPRAELSTSGARRVRAMVDDHHAFVWRSLVRLGVPRSDAEDAVQQVFHVASRRVDDIDAGRERAFLYGTAIRVASRARRTEARRREVMDGEPIELLDAAPLPDEVLDRARARALLDRVLESMPTEVRAVFVLYEIEQLTMVEIAELVGAPQGTVASRLRRARELFANERRRIEASLAHARARRPAAASHERLTSGRKDP